jgi:RimJ/RimL family protein N-acetyltransferase
MFAEPMIQSTDALTVLSTDGAAIDVLRAAVDSVFSDPYVRDRVAHDHRSPGFIAHPDVRYLAARANGRLAGFFLLIDVSPLEVETHAALLRWALPYSRDLGRACLAHVFRDPQVQRASAPVIEGLDSARNYCRKLGFREEGFRRAACMKNGRLLGVHLLGITRAELKGV